MKKKVMQKEKLAPVEQLQEKPASFLIVGIGASAGGIQALQTFFANVPPDSHMAYVVILHLSPDHDSQLANVLQQQSRIPVTQVTEKTVISPDHVYVVPPDRHLTIEGQSIAVSPNLHMEERRAPVDIFFRSLADQHGPRAIIVVLSGTGANGSMGLKRIKERGGATFVQNPREAEFNEMPRSAISTELVDEVLNVADIPPRIIAYRNSIGMVQIIEETEKRPELQQQALRDIFTQLRLRTGHDFSNYKRPTLLRRIERRINVHNLPDLPSYAAHLHENPDETHSLLKDLLISVTNFFRDSKAFNSLEKEVIPAMFAGKTSQDQVRIWVAGCATGEEAYSLAMLCAERTISTIDAPKVQIFATDIDDSAIATAREGLYSLNDAADVSPDRLRRFFTQEGDEYRVRREIREMILFANHNFLKDPPFSKLDLVTCRNVMIYLNSTAQERVIETFHFALRPKKFLFLGTSESVDGASDLYTVYNRDHHIFQTREVAARSYPVPESVPQFQFSKTDLLQKRDERESRGERISFGELHQRMLEQYAPPSVVVNEEYDIVHMTERAGKFFEFSGGEPTNNLLRLVSPQIRLELRAALYQAVQNNTAIEVRNIKLAASGQSQSLDIHVRPVLEEGDTAKGFILIIFKAGVEAGQEGATVTVAADEPIARQLEEELIGLKVQLRNSIEHHEYQAEELKASNEELQAMNEELRSAAEELETSKEELQSINEELRTVNQELKVKIDETSVTSNNLQNLINSANVGTIFLDRSFAIRLFTPAILDIFNLKSGDFGRPITDITNKLQYDNLLPDAELVLERLTIVEREVTTTDNRFFMMRLLPYRTAEDRINGVVITFFDITRRRASEEALRQSEERMRLLIESAKDYAIFTLDKERRVLTWSQGAEMILGYAESEVVGKSGDVIFVPQDRKANVPHQETETAQREGRAENERWHLRKDGSQFWGSGITQPLSDGQGKTIGFVKIMRDLTEQRTMQETLRQSEERYRLQLEQDVELRTAELMKTKEQYTTLVENTPDVITRWDKDLKLLLANTAFETKTGLSKRKLLGKKYSEMGQPQETVLPYMDGLRRAFETGEIVEHFNSTLTPEGLIYFYSRLSPERNAAGEVETVLAIARDITEIKKAEIALERNYLLLKQSEKIAVAGTWDYDRLTGILTWSDGMYHLFNLSKGAELHPDIYTVYATVAYKEAGARISHHIQMGDAEFEEKLTIETGETMKVLHIKAKVIRDERGQPVRVLGVDVDVTASRNAEYKLRQLEAEQQQKIFRLTLRAQEEERRRISESLHNGLGQLLFGIKISMNHIDRDKAINEPYKFEESKKHSEELLSQAIQESRRISHELMPSTLEQFGLRSAIEDVCKQLTGGIKFSCHFSGPEQRPEQYLELAVFRTVQELMLNVVKHSGATRADVVVSIQQELIQIVVSDNGRGIPEPSDNQKGIGLSSIRSKIKLLNGTFQISSGAGRGTQVKVAVPISNWQL